MKTLLPFLFILIDSFPVSGNSNVEIIVDEATYVNSDMPGRTSQDKYTLAMTRLVTYLMDSTETVKQFIDVASNFERIAIAEKNKWLPYYYASFCWVSAAGIEKENSKVDDACKRAKLLLDKAEELSSNNSEILCLKAMILSTGIKVDFMTRGIQDLPKSNELLKQAIKLDKTNPRAYFLSGRNLLGTPSQFGGGKAPAEPYFENAWKIYSTEKVKYAFAPNWGKKLTREILSTIYGKKPN